MAPNDDDVPADDVPAGDGPAHDVPAGDGPAGDGPADAGGQPSGPESALRSLEERLTRASDAAERLIAEAASAATRRPPAAGWSVPSDPGDGDGSGARARAGNGSGRRESTPNDSELGPLIDLVRSLRDLIPPELQRRLGEALRELLLAVRALIDWYLERLEQRRKSPTTIEDIPIL
ncbi:MAG: hypothetical protein ACYDHH_06990 [Solirubrobacteraceae bacterium]